jgi:hypothetical protein
VSPILTRPVREQLEHDRVIRLLQARYKRKHEVIINPGPEQNQSVTVGELSVFPDLLLFGEKGKKLEGTVEVETGESVNQLEALAEWGVFSKLRGVPLHLYVPPSSVDTTRRLCTELQIPVVEIWTFVLQFDQARFTMVYRAPDAPVAKAAKPVPAAVKAVAKPKAAAKAKPAPKAATPKPVATPKSVVKLKPAAKAKPASKPKPAAKAAKKAAPKAAAKKSTKPGKRR